MCSAGRADANPLVFMPFAFGESWYCTQGQGGAFSHQGNQYYGFDFNKNSNVNNSTNPAYSKNLYSPVNGEVVEIRDGVADFQNNAGSNALNNWGWGNTIVIADEEGEYYLRFAHMKFGSNDHLNVGDWVSQGDYIGKVGQTGRSTSPHLHFQVMLSSMGASQPFMFVEGRIDAGDWTKSVLPENTSVIDSNEDIALGSDFMEAYAYGLGTWFDKYTLPNFAGYNYKRHKMSGANDTAYYKWRFRVATSGWYMVYVTFPVDTLNEPSAEYYFGATKVKTMNQSSGTAFVRWVTTQWLDNTTLYTLKVKGKTQDKFLIADAVFLKRL